MPYTEFCCRSGGSNLNAGSRSGSSTEPGTAPDLTYASGSWVAATGVFTVASGNPQSDGVAVGDFASVYAVGATTTGFVGRVTAVSTTTITVSLSAISGTAPTDGAGNRTLRIGGAWAGPTGASGFPFNFLTTALQNAAGDPPRANFKSDTNFAVTATTTDALAGPRVFQGYTSAYGDGGRGVIDGGTTGASYVLLTLSGANNVLADMTFKNNGATGSATGVTLSGRHGLYWRVTVNSVRGSGITATGAVSLYLECEAYACNQSNTALFGGISTGTTQQVFRRCFAHDNAGSNSHGFVTSASANLNVTFEQCIADSNGGNGFYLRGTGGSIGQLQTLLNCDSYSNGGAGVRIVALSTGNGVFLESCNLVKNGTYGVDQEDVLTTHTIVMMNCGFGAGTQANTSGQTNISNKLFVEVGTVTYPNDVTPWVDPANGDFRVTLAAAKAAGRGAFTQTQGGHAGTVGYPDIGAAQHQDAGGGGGGLRLPRPMNGGYSA